jgi:hypothetical protein
MSGHHQEVLPQVRIIMAYNKRSLTPKQAWRLFEDKVAHCSSVEQAAEWLRQHPHIAKKMTGAGLLQCFDEDSGLKKSR